MLSLEAFMQLPDEEMKRYAPKTIMFAVGGTRRDAVLNGVSLYDVRELAEFSMRRFYETVERFFRIGVEHVFAITVHSRQLKEEGPYRDYVVDGSIMAVGELSYGYYESLNCRARFIGHDEIPAFQEVAAELKARTEGNGPGTVWWLASLSIDSVWRKTIAAAQGAKTQVDVIRNYFGEDVPPAELFLSYGKPFIDTEVMLLPLINETQCYWYQRPGYFLTDEEIRRILYDWRFLRNTWIPDKMKRYAEVGSQREIWERNDILGMGQRLGSFWYPLVPDYPGWQADEE